jgi:transposase
MPQSSTPYIGMAVHTEPLAGADVAQDHGAQVTDLSPIGTRPAAIAHLVRQLQSKAIPLVFVDEAGPCGYWLSRYLPRQESACGVVAAVAEAALRDLNRAWDDAIGDLQATKWRLKACMLHHNLRATGRATWGTAPRRGRPDVVCPTPAQPIVFQEDVRTVTEPTERLQRRAPALCDPVNAWRLVPVIDARHAPRGVPFTVAVTMVADLGDLTRFDNPRRINRRVVLAPALPIDTANHSLMS